MITPLVSNITSIDLDHQEYLGTTLEEICYQKAGIIKPGVPVVVGEQRESLRDVIRTEAQVCNARVIIAEDEVRVVSADINGMLRQHREIFRTRTADRSIVARSPLSGDHQARNLACVIAALDVCADILDVTDASIRRGIERIADKTGFGGRIACVSTGPLIIADVGHNEACLRQCTETLRRSPYAHTKFAWVFGVMKDKDYAAMIREMAWCCSVLYAGTPPTERALDSVSLVGTARECGVDAVDCGSISEAFRSALATGLPVLVSGSFTVVDEALTEWKRRTSSEV
ncbi:MAG: bifunctional folylpolyglutamate synthase/dihydrofolate synthase [Candidatus Kapaibacterium sp.]